MTKQKLLHHLAIAAGLIFLGGWFLLAKSLGALDWAITQVPEKYAGAGLMLGIIVIMIPAFLIFKYYNRWVEKTLEVKGIYYEDTFYKKDNDQ